MADANPRCPVAGCGAPMIFCGIGPAAEPFCKFEDTHKAAEVYLGAGVISQAEFDGWANLSIADGVYQAVPTSWTAPISAPTRTIYVRRPGQGYPPGAQQLNDRGRFVMPDDSSPGPDYNVVGQRLAP